MKAIPDAHPDSHKIFAGIDIHRYPEYLSVCLSFSSPLLESTMGSLNTTAMPIAIIGCGLIGPRHALAVQKVPSASLSCIVDPSPAAQAVADSFKVPYFSSITAMTAALDKPEAAIICTPNHTHADLGKELLDAGVHILVEKPIATESASGRDLVRLPLISNICATGIGASFVLAPSVTQTAWHGPFGQVVNSFAVGGPDWNHVGQTCEFGQPSPPRRSPSTIPPNNPARKAASEL
jgi:Oxidoreductase family, NAD-binding Rossmann fold